MPMVPSYSSTPNQSTPRSMSILLHHPPLHQTTNPAYSNTLRRPHRCRIHPTNTSIQGRYQALHRATGRLSSWHPRCQINSEKSILRRETQHVNQAKLHLYGCPHTSSSQSFPPRCTRALAQSKGGSSSPPPMVRPWVCAI